MNSMPQQQQQPQMQPQMQPNYYPQQGMQQQQQQHQMMSGQGMQNPQQMMYNQQQQQQQQQQPQMMNQQQQQQPRMMNQQQQQPPQARAPQPQSMQSRQPQQQQQPSHNSNNNSSVVRSLMSRPPYVDPNTNIIYDTENAEYEGYLTKQSMWLKDWRRRFFLLKGSKLFYCSNEYSTPHGMIDLALCTTVKSADLKSRKRNSFEISTPEITYLLYADTEQEKDDWIGRVGKAIVRCSSTYYKGKGQQGSGNNININNNNPYGSGAYHQQSAMDSDDDDIYYEDPNNPMPYFND